MSEAQTPSDDDAQSETNEFTAYIQFVGDALAPDYIDLEDAAELVEPYLKMLQVAEDQTLDTIIVSGNYRVGQLIDDNMDADVETFDYDWRTFLDDDHVQYDDQPDLNARDDPDGINFGDVDDRRCARAKSKCWTAMTEKAVDDWEGNEMANADAMLSFHCGTDDAIDAFSTASRGQNPLSQYNPDRTVEFAVDVNAKSIVDWSLYFADTRGFDSLSDDQQADLRARLNDNELQAVGAQV